MTGEAFRTEGIIGHEASLEVLRREVSRPGHSYLFVGPATVGKATVALAFAAALVSRTEEGRGRVMRRVHPDVSVMGPEGRATLGVDQARRAITGAGLRPVESDRKVFIFDEASMMTEAAANALLKTLEEPPAGAVFIVVADSEDDLPATVASRCRVIRFGRVSETAIFAALEERGVASERATTTARIAGGSPGLALDLVANEKVGEFRRRWLEVPGRVGSHPGDGFRLADGLLKAPDPLLETVKQRHKREIEELESRGYPVPKSLREAHARELRSAGNALLIRGLEMLASCYVDSASAQHGGPIGNPDLSPADLAAVPPRRAVRSAELVLDAAAQLRRNQRPRLVLAWLFAGLGEGR